MDLPQIIPHIEALIFASEKPLTTGDILELINNALAFIEERASAEEIGHALEIIQAKFADQSFAFEIKESGGGWQFLTKKEYYKTVAQLNGDKFLKKLSTAALETLSIIAYKQPVTKSEIEIIRGVNCDYAVQKLLEKELILITGRKEDAVGKPLIYATSKSFMDYFGINSPEDLPKIKEVFLEELVEATRIENIILPELAGNATLEEVDYERIATEANLLPQKDGGNNLGYPEQDAAGKPENDPEAFLETGSEGRNKENEAVDENITRDSDPEYSAGDDDEREPVNDDENPSAGEEAEHLAGKPENFDESEEITQTPV